jgi:hypothetical protein
MNGETSIAEILAYVRYADTEIRSELIQHDNNLCHHENGILIRFMRSYEQIRRCRTTCNFSIFYIDS